MSERKTYYLFCGEIHTGGTPPMDLDSRLILHDHGGATCDRCITTTLNELNTLAAQLAAVTAERDEAQADVKRLEGAFDAAIRERDEVLPYREYLAAATERAEKAEARAVAHWAECEAWRAAYKEWSEGDYHFREPTNAREASDRARNPILELPPQGGENPGAV